MHEHTHRVRTDACSQPGQRHLKALTADDVRGSPIQGEAGPDQQSVPKGRWLLPILVTENVGLQHPKQTVGSVKSGVDPRCRIVPLIKVMHERKAGKNRRPFVTVDEVLLFHGCTNKIFPSSLPWLLSNARLKSNNGTM